MLSGRIPIQPGRRRAQRGLSLVEMMVGIAVAMIIVAAATMTVATQLSDNRRLLTELQVQQDLRAATDTISRELRRAGFWVDAGTQVPVPGSTLSDMRNPRAALVVGGSSKLEYQYDRIAAAPGNAFGFCQGAACPTASPGTIRSKLSRPDGAGSFWHELTDDKAVNITAMTITPLTGPTTKLACPSLCADGSTACWPTIAVREALITVTGQAVSDPAVQRTLTSRVRLRNDVVTIAVPGTGVAGSLVACPAS